VSTDAELSFVMAGLVPAIHVLLAARKTWMPGTRPGMTVVRSRNLHAIEWSALVATSAPRVSEEQCIANAMPAPALVGLGVGPSLSPSPKARGCGAPSRRGREKKPRQSAAHARVPLSLSTGPGPNPGRSSRRGFPGVRPGVQLRATPAGAASRSHTHDAS